MPSGWWGFFPLCCWEVHFKTCLMSPWNGEYWRRAVFMPWAWALLRSEDRNKHTHSRSGAISFIIWIARNDRLQKLSLEEELTRLNWKLNSQSLSGSLSQLTTLCNFSTPTTWTVHESISLGLWLKNGSKRKIIFHLCILTSVSYTYFKFSGPQIWMKSLFRTVYVFFLHSARLRDEEKWNFTSIATFHLITVQCKCTKT